LLETPAAPEAQATSRSPLVGAALQSAILTGAADFFVERAEQEMSLFAVEVVGNELCSDTSPAREFLPKTCELIGPKAATTGDVLGPTPGAIRAAAKADLEALPVRVVEQLAEKNQKRLACAAAFGWGVADEVSHGADLVTLLKDPRPVLERRLVKDHCDEVVRKDLAALAEHLKRHLSGDPALVASVLRSGNFERLVSTERALTTAKDGELSIGAPLTEAGTTISEVLRRVVELDRAITAYRANPVRETRVVMVIAAIQTVEPVMAYMTRGAKYAEDVHTTVDFLAQVLNRQYTEAVVTASSLKAVAILPPSTRNLVSLAAGLAQAESSDDVRKTLGDAALPLGSWRRKNAPRFGATLTGMVGGYAAYEFVTETPDDELYVTDGASIAPSLLVGADLHQGFSWGRVGLHFNVLDLGALASVRLDDPEVKDQDTDSTVPASANLEAEAQPDVEFEQVFAPGVYAYFGFGPFNFGPAVTFVPSLRPYRDSSGDVKPLSVWRVGGVVAVDVSVLPLF
jgi:hypothetical protein